MGRLVQRAEVNAAIGWMVFAAGAVLVLAWAVLGSLMALDQLSRGKEDVWIGPLVMAVMFVPIGLVLMIKGWSGRVLRFELFEYGVTYRESKRDETILWNDVTAVFWEQYSHEHDIALGASLTVRRTAKVTIVSRSHAPVVVDERFPGHVELAALARDCAGRAMLPMFEAVLASGGTVVFGAMIVAPWGIQLPSGSFPWEAVASMRWESSGPSAWYAIRGVDGAELGSLDAHATPNLVVLCALLERMGKLAPSVEQASLGAELFDAAKRLFTY